MKSARNRLIAVIAVSVGAACSETSASDDGMNVGSSAPEVEAPVSAPAPSPPAVVVEEPAEPVAALPEPEAEPEQPEPEQVEPEAEPAIDPSSIYAGVYNATQATRGEELQEKECGTCHMPEDWADGRLLRSYTGQSAYDFLENIRATMPMDAPGRLSYQEYTDIVAFILHLNEVPAGDAELPADEAELAEFRMEYRR